MWWMRHLVLVAAAAVALSDGWRAKDAVPAAALLLDAVNHRVVVVRPRLASAVIVVDAMALAVLAALGLPTLVVLVLAVAMLAWAATFRPLAAVASYVGASTAAWTAFASADGLRPAVPMTAFALLGAIFLIRMIRLNMGARHAAEREHIVSEGVDAIIWEALPGSDGALRVSPAAQRLLGYPASAFEAPGFARSLIHPDDVDRAGPIWAGEGSTATTFRLRRDDGDYRWFENHTSHVAPGRAAAALIVGVLVDRTDQLEVERNALALGHLMTSSPIGQVMLCRRHGVAVIEALNPASLDVLGITIDAIGQPFGDVVTEPLVDPLLRLAEQDGEHTIELAGADGRIYQATGRHHDEESCSLDFLDVTERVEHRETLHHQARHDDLTGLMNRRGLLETLDRHLDESSDAVSLVLLDLDDFKEVNDSLGHATGDRLLAEIARRLASCAGANDAAARLGGDEFAIVLPGAGPEAAVARAEHLQRILHEPVQIGELRLRVRASLGIASHPLDADDAAELIRRADVAMYSAKQRNNGVERYNPRTDPFDRDRLALTGELEDAIANGELTLHHQPVQDLRTGRIVGTEALVRWNHPRLGLVPPDKFIELAEVSGLIRPLTRWVVRQALADTTRLALDDDDPFKVSVNLSVHNLYEHDLLDWIRASLDEFGLPAHRLVAEITESTIMDEQAVAVGVLEGLRALGIRTWIDDFGTGHSSFARLRALPVDGVKIDRTFVSGDSPGDRIVLRSIVDLVRSLGLTSVAEGIEDADTLDVLRSLGCDLAQGYHIARPMPFEDLCELRRRAVLVS